MLSPECSQEEQELAKQVHKLIDSPAEQGIAAARLNELHRVHAGSNTGIAYLTRVAPTSVVSGHGA